MRMGERMKKGRMTEWGNGLVSVWGMSEQDLPALCSCAKALSDRVRRLTRQR